MTLANCLNLPYKVFKQFACFSDALYLFFNSVKYFNKPKPRGVFFVCLFFRCLNCARTLPPSVLFWLSFLFFQFFFHLMSVSGFCQITLLVGMFYPPQFVFSFTALMYSTNPSVVGICKNNS
uniref:Uncharacterized protein n=1 Tax=Pipistrellus kuhlii TaxID=59472 RepID=A0A7J7ZJJ8_PIPKU|nr:hypothetical protein mPipKuh1_009512 [Pipistrellus kuhlii]